VAQLQETVDFREIKARVVEDAITNFMKAKTSGDSKDEDSPLFELICNLIGGAEDIDHDFNKVANNVVDMIWHAVKIDRLSNLCDCLTTIYTRCQQNRLNDRQLNTGVQTET
jgi:hypothetical protein